MLIVSCYAPQSGHPEKERQQFYTDLRRLLDETPKKYIGKTIILGDFNGWVGASGQRWENAAEQGDDSDDDDGGDYDAYDSVRGPCIGDRDVSDNGMKLLQFCADTSRSKGYVIANSMFEREHTGTWRARSQVGQEFKRTPDHILVSREMYYDECRVEDAGVSECKFVVPEDQSDHRLSVMRLTKSANVGDGDSKAVRGKKGMKRGGTRARARDLSMLKKLGFREQYRSLVGKALEGWLDKYTASSSSDLDVRYYETGLSDVNKFTKSDFH